MTTQPLAGSAATLLFILLSPVSLFAQGSLTPPGPPGATMKTLDQVEPRTPLDAAHTATDGTNMFIINAPGSYYLTGNLTGVAGKNGILIQAANVSLDLNGFTISGTGAAHKESGIVDGTGSHIFNGRIDNWGGDGITATRSVIEHVIATKNGVGFNLSGAAKLLHAVASGSGTYGVGATGGAELSYCDFYLNGFGGFVGNNCRLDHCTFSSNSGYGLLFTDGCVITESIASLNSGTGFIAIFGSSGALVDRCTANGNAEFGIAVETGAGVIISNCAVNGNASDGIVAAGTGHVIRDCVVTNNAATSGNGVTAETRCSITNCLVTGNGSVGNSASGIFGGIRTLISGCNVSHNKGTGIHAAGDSTVRDNRACENLIHGINSSSGSGSVVEGNQARDNGAYGIVASNGDIVIRNFAGANATGNFSPNNGPNFGPVQSPSTANNPLGNIGY